MLGPGAKPIVGTLRISADIGKDPSRCTFHDIGFVEDLLGFLRTLWNSNQITSAKFEDLLGRPLRHLKEMTCKDGKPIEMFFLGNRRWEYDLLYSQSMGGVVDTGRTPTSPHTTAVPMDSINLRKWLALIAMVGFNHFARGIKHLGSEFERGEKGTLHFKDAQLLIAFGYMSDTTRKLFFGQKFPGRHVRDRFDRDFRATLYSLREGLKRPITLVDVMVRLAIDERAMKALLSPTEFTDLVWSVEPRALGFA